MKVCEQQCFIWIGGGRFFLCKVSGFFFVGGGVDNIII